MHGQCPITYRYFTLRPVGESVIRMNAAQPIIDAGIGYKVGDFDLLELHSDMLDARVGDAIVQTYGETEWDVFYENIKALCVFSPEKIDIRRNLFVLDDDGVSQKAIPKAYDAPFNELWIDFRAIEDCGTKLYAAPDAGRIEDYFLEPFEAVYPDYTATIQRTGDEIHISIVKDGEVYLRTQLRVAEAERIDVDNYTSPYPLYAVYNKDAFYGDISTTVPPYSRGHFYIEPGKDWWLAVANKSHICESTDTRYTLNFNDYHDSNGHSDIPASHTLPDEVKSWELTEAPDSFGYTHPVYKRISMPTESKVYTLNGGTHEDALPQEIWHKWECESGGILIDNLPGLMEGGWVFSLWEPDYMQDYQIFGDISPHRCMLLGPGPATVTKVELTLRGPVTDGFQQFRQLRVEFEDEDHNLVHSYYLGSSNVSGGYKWSISNPTSLMKSWNATYMRLRVVWMRCLPVEFVNSFKCITLIKSTFTPGYIASGNAAQNEEFSLTRYVQRARTFYLYDPEYFDDSAETGGPSQYYRTKLEISALVTDNPWRLSHLGSNIHENPGDLPDVANGVITFNRHGVKLSSAPIRIICVADTICTIIAPPWSSIQYSIWRAKESGPIDGAEEVTLEPERTNSHTLSAVSEYEAGGVSLDALLTNFNRQGFIGWIFQPFGTDVWQIVDRYSNPMSTDLLAPGTYTAVREGDERLEEIRDSGGIQGGYNPTAGTPGGGGKDIQGGDYPEDDTGEDTPGEGGGEGGEGGEGDEPGGTPDTITLLVDKDGRILVADKSTVSGSEHVATLHIVAQFGTEVGHTITCNTSSPSGAQLSTLGNPTVTGTKYDGHHRIAWQNSVTLTGENAGALLRAGTIVNDDKRDKALIAVELHCASAQHLFRVTITNTTNNQSILLIDKQQTGRFLRTIPL